MSTPSVACGSCGEPIPEPTDFPASRRSPCPKCGSTRRLIAVGTAESVTHHERLGFKVKRPGYKKPVLDAKGGDSQSDDGTWATIDQRIDRTNDPPWYTKKVVKADGTVVRDVSYPLSEHTGRGSAEPKP